MSVIGFDIGNLNCYIAVARQGGVEVITNDYSLHATPYVCEIQLFIYLFSSSCVYFDDRSRVAGVAAKQKMLTKLSNTVTSIKHLIGRKFSDPIVQAERAWVPCEVVQLPNDGVGLKVVCCSVAYLFTFVPLFRYLI